MSTRQNVGMSHVNLSAFMLAGMSECEMSERPMSKHQNIQYRFLLPCGGLPVHVYVRSTAADPTYTLIH
eukprot:1809854-Karenia_brevis.AAC.1